MKTRLLCIFLLFSLYEVAGFPIRISLYNSSQVRSVVVSSWNVSLTVLADGGFQYVIAEEQAVYATLRDGKILLMGEQGEIGSFERIVVRGADSLAVVRLRPTSPQLEARNYENMIIMTASADKIQFINQIDEERYIAGVAEAEAGQGHTNEFYKAKAIICRTYLYGNLNRHPNEDFHLCDEVHCQVYKGQCRSGAILPAVTATGSIIIVDPADLKPILATYHSNCGGETEASQNVWQSSLPYLVSTIDPYCTSSSNARWQRNIPLNEWNAYLVRNGYSPNPNVAANFSFQQPRRATNYTINNVSIPLRNIRTDWQLRSTFFSVSVEGGNVVLSGRGFGHGVGLCQEGAIEMGRRGFNYEDIIKFYYRNVILMNYTNQE